MDNDTLDEVMDPTHPEQDLWEDERPPTPVLGLDAAQRRALGAAVRAGLRGAGCDNTLRAAQHWAAGAGSEWPSLRERLESNGGYCDCELLLNVLQPDPEPD
jgi:hypothetical protein